MSKVTALVRTAYRWLSPDAPSESARRQAKRISTRTIQPARQPPADEAVPLRLRLKKALRGKDSAFFVQVGSNDGVHGDPIHDLIMENPGWKGIFIEPVPAIFERLKANYENSPRFVYENVLVGPSGQVKTFYYVSEQARIDRGHELPGWFDQLGSFNRDHITKHVDGLEPYIIEARLKCLTLDEILQQNQVKKLDLVHIDVEGYDYEVLKQLNLKRYAPSAILYENKHLGSHKPEAEAYLTAAGYDLFDYDSDTLAIIGRQA